MNTEQLTAITHTIEGYPVRNLKWNPLDNILVGQAKDPVTGRETHLEGYVIVQWRLNGKTTNKLKGRADLALNLKHL